MEKKRESIAELFALANANLKSYIEAIVQQPGMRSLQEILGPERSAAAGEGRKVVDDLEECFRAVAEHLITTVAKHTLAAAPKKWTAEQVECVRRPMLAFGLIKDDELSDAAELREAVLELTEDDGRGRTRAYFPPGGCGHLVACVTRFAIEAIRKEKSVDPQKDPRSNLVCLTAASHECYFNKIPRTCGESNMSECVITWSQLKPDDVVIPFRVEFVMDPPASRVPGEWIVEEGILDHAWARDRLAGIDDELAQSVDKRVSDLAKCIVNYSRTKAWLTEQFVPKIIEPGIEYAAGVGSSAVLAGQRAKGAGNKQPPPVLKKNNPSKAQECFTAFERCTWFDDAVTHFADMYYQFKRLQVDYIVACHIIGRISRHNTSSAAAKKK